MNRRKLRQALSPWITAGGFFVVWELACLAFDIPQSILPSPIDSVKAGIEFWPVILSASLQTLYTTLVGFFIALVVGVALGALVGSSQAMYRATNPLLIGFNSVPKVAMVPVLVMWFGIGSVPAILTAFLTAFFPILANVATGIATLEPELADVLRSLGAKRSVILRKVGLPRSLPYLFASLKVAISLAFVGSVIAEMVASDGGIGYLLLTASSSFRVPLVFAALLVVGVLGILVGVIADLIERRSTRWATRGGGSL